MKIFRPKISLFVVAILLVAAVGSYAQSAGAARGNRGFLFQIGAGPAGTSYGAAVDNQMSYLTTQGATRIRLYLNLDLGYAAGENVYLVAGIDGVGDRLEYGGAYMQTNTYFYHAGLRVYPFHTGLVLGVDGGATNLVLQSNLAATMVSSLGWGGGGMIAYDFSRRPIGFGVEVGARGDYLTIEGSPVALVSLYGDLLWK